MRTSEFTAYVAINQYYEKMDSSDSWGWGYANVLVFNIKPNGGEAERSAIH